MAIVQQKTYTCGCGKKRDIPASDKPVTCGCGRVATAKDGRVVLSANRKK